MVRVFTIIYTTNKFRILLFYEKTLKKFKKPFSKYQRAGNGQAPLIGHVQNFLLGWIY